MLFGLLTGSYEKSKSGGVVRKDIGTIKDEINWDTDGTLKSLVGIIRTMDQLRPAGYSNYTSNAGGKGVDLSAWPGDNPSVQRRRVRRQLG